MAVLYIKNAQGTFEAVPSIGVEGKSAYQVWLDAGNTGTISAYLESLKGEKGDKGDTGATPTTFINSKNNAQHAMWIGTQAEYDAIVTKIETTIYIIT